jgi:hypothetical protein
MDAVDDAPEEDPGRDLVGDPGAPPRREYQYRLVVDGEWRDHAEAPRRVSNPYGTENCVLTVA